MAKELLVPRRTIHFTPLEEGRFVEISPTPELLKQPMVREMKGSVRGIESGWRSGLIKVNDELYKLKGCRPTGKTRKTGDPKGSQTLSLAQYEADRTLERREVFLQEGFEYPIEPIGFWVYDHILHEGEPNTATIYKVKGDTRLDELLWWIEQLPFRYAPKESEERISQILGKSGLITGYMLKILHRNNFSWDADSKGAYNANSGNVLIFPDAKGKAQFGIVDFDNSNNYYPIDPEEDIAAMEITQQRDLKNLKDWIENKGVVSRARYIKTRPHLAPDLLIERILKRAASDISKEDIKIVGDYLLKALNPRHTDPSLRELFVNSFEQGYSEESLPDSEISWNDLLTIMRDVRSQRSEFSTKAKSQLGEPADRKRVMDLAKKYSVFHGYDFPIVVNIEEIPIASNDAEVVIFEPTVKRKEDLVTLSSKLANLHQDHLAQYPSTGESYFSFPKVSQDILMEHASLNKKDIADIVHLWIDGSLKDILSQKFSPRALGSFMLTLAQTNSQQLAESLMANLPDINDPRLIEKLTRVNEFYEVLPDVASQPRGFKNYIWELVNLNSRSDAFYIEREVKKRSAIPLFERGIITRDFTEIFNHQNSNILLNEFAITQAPALKAAMECPELVDRFGGSENTIVQLQIALTGAQVRNGQQKDLDFVPKEALEESEDRRKFRAAYLQYLFASSSKDEVTDINLKNAMDMSIGGWSANMMESLIVAEKPLHPNSFLAQNYGKTPMELDDLASILKTALDLTNGDLSKLDPTIRSFLEKRVYEGSISKEKASELTLACIGLGIEFPEFLEPYLIQSQNSSVFMQFLSEKSVKKEGGIYGSSKSYPVNPTYKLMSEGKQALPTKLRQILTEQIDNKADLTLLANEILEHLFVDDGYFRNFFGAMINMENYPKPTTSMRDMRGLGRPMWKIVHPDIWDILNLADATVLVDFFESKVKDRKVRMEFRSDDSRMIGYRDASLSECLPPELYGKLSSLPAV